MLLSEYINWIAVEKWRQTAEFMFKHKPNRLSYTISFEDIRTITSDFIYDFFILF